MSQVRANGQDYAICNVDGEIYAVHGVCPHRGAPLAYGALHQHTIVCPWHAWEFDLTDGHALARTRVRLRSYPVAVRDGHIVIDGV